MSTPSPEDKRRNDFTNVHAYCASPQSTDKRLLTGVWALLPPNRSHPESLYPAGTRMQLLAAWVEPPPYTPPTHSLAPLQGPEQLEQSCI